MVGIRESAWDILSDPRQVERMLNSRGSLLCQYLLAGPICSIRFDGAGRSVDERLATEPS